MVRRRVASEKLRLTVWVCANVFGLWWSVKFRAMMVSARAYFPLTPFIAPKGTNLPLGRARRYPQRLPALSLFGSQVAVRAAPARIFATGEMRQRQAPAGRQR